MALLVGASRNFIQLSLDAVVDFDATADLEGFGLNSDASDGLRVRKITFIPSAAGDTLIVRDGDDGPIAFAAVDVLGTYDVLKDEYREDGKKDIGKLMNPYIHADECVIGVAHNAFVIFEL